MSRYFKPGTKVIVRGAAFHYIGRVAYVEDGFLCLEEAEWIEAHGSVDQLDYFPDPVDIAIGSIIDITEYRGDLPLQANKKIQRGLLATQE